MASYEISYLDPNIKPYRVHGVQLNISGTVVTFRDTEGRVMWVFRLDGKRDDDPKEINRVELPAPDQDETSLVNVGHRLAAILRERGDKIEGETLVMLTRIVNEVLKPEHRDEPLKQHTFER